jgi:hypothetical protein
MPHHFNCCVPGCLNNFIIFIGYYRIPKCQNLRKKYKILLRNETLKLDSNQTRICSEHFEGGEKLSHHHLPSVFPWSKQGNPRREIIEHKDVYSKRRKESAINQSNQTATVSGVDTMDTAVLDETVHEERVNEMDQDVFIDQTRETETINLLCITGGSQTDVDLKQMEEIIQELNQFREKNQQLKAKCNDFIEKKQTSKYNNK